MNIRVLFSTMALAIFMMSASFAKQAVHPILFIKIVDSFEETSMSLEIKDLWIQFGLNHNKAREIFDKMAPGLICSEIYNVSCDAIIHDEIFNDLEETIKQYDLFIKDSCCQNGSNETTQREQRIIEIFDKYKSTAGLCWEKINLVSQKINAIIKDIAKKRGAYAAIQASGRFDYVDPSCDITDEVYDRLNKEYLKTKNR